jgi:tetratricopeptide (TPR) repeat protein
MGISKSGLKGKEGKNKSIEDTEAWGIADFDYVGLITQDMMPLLSAPLAGQERRDYLRDILKGCPEYYPALIELGYRYIKEGMDETGKASIDKGLQSLKTHFSKEYLIDSYYSICEFLEKHLRYEMAIEYYNQLIAIESDKANVYDSISCCHSDLGDTKKAFEIQQKALELCDSNHRFYCNMGWLEMIRGNPDAAKLMLEKSLELDQEDEITLNNYGVCKLMLEDKRLTNWDAYLLRETDYEYLEKLEDEGDFEEYEKQIRIYNHDMLEAFKSYLIQNPEYTPAEKYDILFSLKYIMDHIGNAYDSEYFFYDSIDLVEADFKHIMHTIILTTGDIDNEIFDGIYTALLEFYKFLEKRKVVSGYRSLKNKMLESKPELVEKMLRYNEMRHDDEYTEEEKNDIRDELFGDDVFLPFI